MQSKLVGATLLACVTQVQGGGVTTHSKHDDWWYGASETTTGSCATVDDADRCGPSDWSTVAGDAACKEVGTQSPINILTSSTAGSSLKALDLQTSGAFTKANYELNGHTTEVAFTGTDSADKMKIVWDGVDYFLKQFHFHSPSENVIDGKYYPMEVHHVHQDASNNAFVLSVMMKTGDAANSYYADVWSEIDKVTPGALTATKWEVEGSFTKSPYDNVLPSDRSYFYYMGSFTTPPCTTNTRWVVFQTPITISNDQLMAYRSKIQGVPQKQLALCDTARCGGTTPTGVATYMKSGTSWNATQGTNNRPLQLLTGAQSSDRAVTTYKATSTTTKAAASGDSTTTGSTASGAHGRYIHALGLVAIALSSAMFAMA